MKQNDLKDAFSRMSNILGTKFLNYILNDSNIYTQNADINKYDLNRNQLETISNLDSVLIELNGINSYNDTTNLEYLLFVLSQTGIFNQWREYNNGIIPNYETDNLILNFILKKAINYYPSLLIKGREHNIDLVKFNSRPSSNKKDLQILQSLIESDPKFCRYYYKEIYFGRIVLSFGTEPDMVFLLHDFVEDLVFRCFKNCCLMFKYDLESYINEIKIQFKQIYDYNKNKEFRVSHFYGLKGVYLSNEDNIKLSDNMILRNVDSIHNPYRGLNNIMTDNNTNDGSFLSGSVIEIRQLIQTNNQSSNNFYTQKEALNLFKNSLPFALNPIKNPLHVVFYDRSISYHNYFRTDSIYSSHGIKISNNDIESISIWMQIIKSNYNKFKVTFDRFSLAIYERDNPTDVILDCFIVWESLLSENIETTFKISTALHFLLKDKTKFDYIFFKKLYELRSKIVHGSEIKKDLNGFSDYNIGNISELSDCIIKLTSLIIKEIVDNVHLNVLKPSQRIKKIIFGYHSKEDKSNYNQTSVT